MPNTQGPRERWGKLAAHDKMLLLAIPFILAASYFYQPYCHRGPVICTFRAMTGLPCPGCGLTRAFCEIARGNIGASLAMHPLGLVLLAFMAWFVFNRVRFVFTRHKLPQAGGRLYWAAAVVLMAQHVLRLGLWIATQPHFFRDRLSAGIIPRIIMYVING